MCKIHCISAKMHNNMHKIAKVFCHKKFNLCNRYVYDGAQAIEKLDELLPVVSYYSRNGGLIGMRLEYRVTKKFLISKTNYTQQYKKR